MNDEPESESLELERWDEQVTAIARAFPYPPTPDVAPAVRGRLARSRGSRRGAHRHASRRPARKTVAVGVVVLVLLALLAVPPVRAAVQDVLRIGAIRFLPFITGVPTSAPAARAVPPVPTRRPRLAAGTTTLAAAQARAGFHILLPAYPPRLGPPDEVYLEHPFGGQPSGALVVLTWRDPHHPERVRFSLYELGTQELLFEKMVQVVRTTTVRGQPAVWGQGPHFLRMLRGDRAGDWRPVESSVLVWTHRGRTYRMETTVPLREAVRIAESLH
jgi:hypothetical protein